MVTDIMKHPDMVTDIMKHHDMVTDFMKHSAYVALYILQMFMDISKLKIKKTPNKYHVSYNKGFHIQSCIQ